jgi:hypothetical protein
MGPLQLRLSRLNRRSWHLDFCLAATTIFLWNLLNALGIRLGFGFDSLHFALDIGSAQSEWPWPPWVVSTLGLAASFLRGRRGGAGLTAIRSLLVRTTLVCSALLLLRLFSLWEMAGHLIPYLSLLWSPHANWALNALYLFPALGCLPVAWMGHLRRLSNRSLYAASFLCSAVLYGAYTLYFCQITMLHGDEGQYLLVTQSLIRDSDMDLSNNIEAENIREFHVLDAFGIHKAPGSPAGKIHSVHPIGLSILLVPPYLAGLGLWQNPRLACALTMSLMAAGCVALMLAWLIRLRMPRWAALAAATITAGTGPLFLYSTQLFPDLPALLISLIALCALAHWQIPGGGYQSWGRLELFWLASLSAILAFLPFLHARFTPIALLAGVGVITQIRGSPHTKAGLAPVLGVFVVAIVLLLQFNLAFSGDWMGPFKPGNAWEEGAIDAGTWWTSLPGHWLHGGVGLVNSSPIYLFSLLGLALLAKNLDRRLAIGVAVYLSTAVVNGMHPDWKFGFCLPARFLVTALPCLALGLAAAMNPIARNPGLAFLALFAFCVSADSLCMNLVLTEESYVGDNLFARSLNHYYPWQAHFNSDETLGFLSESFFVGLLVVGLFARHVSARLGTRRMGVALVAGTALIPTIWGQTERLTARLGSTTSHFLNRLDAEGGVGTRKTVGYNLNLKPLTFVPRKDGSIHVVGGEHSPGLVARAYMPILEPGSYVLKLPNLEVRSEGAVRAPGHLLMLRRETVHAKSIWETRTILPLTADRDRTDIIFHINRTALGFTYLHFGGSGSILLRRARLLHSPGFGNLKRREIHRAKGGERPSPEAPLAHMARFPSIQPGSYSVTARLRGTTAHTLMDRSPLPIEMAVFLQEPDSSAGAVEDRIRSWFGSQRELVSLAAQARPVFPKIETIQPPWWMAIPVLGADKYQLEFSLFKPAEVWVALKYGGPLDIGLDEIVLTQIEPGHRRPLD